ncbi:MAG: flagellar filament capping protein FliD, partial [Lachnospiraceae bacterium]|nr:flagellar filament capping protein FliD [Lachnospiraceae bacterium]
VSGMDTDAMIEEIVSAYSTKKDKVFKQRKTLEYKQEAWKDLNSKIYGFYTGSLSNMQLTSHYSLKNTTSSNEKKATVSASTSAVNGTQELKIKQLAKTAYLTGAKIETSSGGAVKESTKLSELGIKDSKLKITVGGEEKTLNLKASMSIKELKAELGDMGLTTSFDEHNGRFFISAKTGGVEADFTIVGDGEEGADALKKLGLSVVSDSVIDDYRKYVANNNATTIEANAKKDYVADLLKQYKVGIPDEIKELQEKLDTDTTLTEEEKTAITEKITLLNTQSQEIGESLKSNDLADMERYATVLGLAVDYADTNVDYQKYVKTYEDKFAYAKDMVDYADLYEKSKKADGLTTAEKTQLDELKAKYGELYNSGAVKIDGQDAIIELNGAEFISNSNSFQINGLTINAKALTDEDEIITITTDTDVDAIYDKIKSFFKEYNELMTEMATKYNAPSAGDYEPLTEAEEEELSETQLEKWEGILKTASLRRDGTLSTVMSSMKSVMIKSYQIDGKTYSLSSFGIKTAGYFTAEDNEKANYHIDGDPDDESSKANADKLKAALVADPENTIEFFSNIMKDLYKTLSDKLSKSTSTSSAFKIYNDKTMQSQYDSYTKKLSTWEDKIEDYRDKYVKKFSAMETAMAKLQSQTASLSSFFGTGM